MARGDLGDTVGICGRVSGAAARALRRPLISMRSSAICAFKTLIVALRRIMALAATTIDMLASAMSAAVEAGRFAARCKRPPTVEQMTANVASMSASVMRPEPVGRGGSIVGDVSVMARLAIR